MFKYFKILALKKAGKSSMKLTNKSSKRYSSIYLDLRRDIAGLLKPLKISILKTSHHIL